MDKYLSNKRHNLRQIVRRDTLELLAVTSYFIASKLEDVRQVTIK